MPIIIGGGEFVYCKMYKGLIMIVFSCHCCVANASNGYDNTSSQNYMQIQANTT